MYLKSLRKLKYSDLETALTFKILTIIVLGQYLYKSQNWPIYYCYEIHTYIWTKRLFWILLHQSLSVSSWCSQRFKKMYSVTF